MYKFISLFYLCIFINADERIIIVQGAIYNERIDLAIGHISTHSSEDIKLEKLSFTECYRSSARGIAVSVIKGGRYAVYHFRGKREDITGAYAFLYGRWLPPSGFLPDDKPLIEIYPPDLHTDNDALILEYDIALPVILI